MSNYCNKGHWEEGLTLPCKQCEIESMRQQLAEKDQTILDHVEIQNSLRHQLHDAIKREVMMRDSLEKLSDFAKVGSLEMYISEEALAATTDLDGLILCENNPVGFYLNREEFFDDWYSSVQLSEKWEPLYRAWEPK